LNIRRLTDKDWDTLVSWWDNWPKWKAPTKDFLPENGKGGLIVEINDTPVVAGFIYLTNSKLAFINDIIYDKNKDEKLLHNSLDLLIVAFEQTLKELGFKTIVIINTDEMLNNSYKALGWKEDITINKLIKNL